MCVLASNHVPYPADGRFHWEERQNIFSENKDVCARGRSTEQRRLRHCLCPVVTVVAEPAMRRQKLVKNCFFH